MATAKKPAAAPDLFASAASVVPKAKGKAKTDNRAEHKVKGLENLAIVNAAIDNLTALKKTMEGPVKAQLRTVFIETGTAVKKRPDNFRGVEQTATASCEFRKRGTNQPLNELEVAAFEKAGIPTETVTIVPAAFIINPKYAEDKDVLAAISKALVEAGVPTDVFMKQEAETKICVPDSALDVIFTKKPDVIERLVDSVCVLAVKTNIEETVNVTDMLTAALKLAKPELEAE